MRKREREREREGEGERERERGGERVCVYRPRLCRVPRGHERSVRPHPPHTRRLRHHHRKWQGMLFIFLVNTNVKGTKEQGLVSSS